MACLIIVNGVTRIRSIDITGILIPNTMRNKDFDARNQNRRFSGFFLSNLNKNISIIAVQGPIGNCLAVLELQKKGSLVSNQAGIGKHKTLR